MSKHTHTEGPWVWRDFGSRLMLVTLHQGSRVVVSADPRTGHLKTRDKNGTLKYLEADHPNARLIAAAPELHQAGERAMYQLLKAKEALHAAGYHIMAGTCEGAALELQAALAKAGRE